MSERKKRRAKAGMPDVKIRLPRDLLEKAWARAQAEDRSLGGLLRKLIADGLQKTPDR